MPLFGGSLSTRLVKEAKRGDWAKVDELLVELQGQNSNIVNSPDSNGWTALHWGTWNGHLEVVQSLARSPHINLELKTIDKSRTALHLAAIRGLDRIFAELLGAGARVDTTDYGGYTPLHAAAEAGHGLVVRLLLEHLARKSPQHVLPVLEIKDRECGWTALHWAAYQGHAAVVRRLVDLGADPASTDAQGRTPADIVCTGRRAKSQSRHSVMQELQQPARTPNPSPQVPPANGHQPAPSWSDSFSVGSGPRPGAYMPHPGLHSMGQSVPPSEISSESCVHLGTASSSQAPYPNNRYRASTVGSGALSSAPTPAALQTGGSTASLPAGTHYNDARQPSDQASTRSRSPSSSHEALMHANCAPPGRPQEAQAMGSTLGASRGAAAGTGALLLGGTIAVMGAAASGNPGAIVKGILEVTTKLSSLCDDAVYCRYKAKRLRARTQALLQCLPMLTEKLQHTGSLQAACKQTLSSLQQVLENIFNLVVRFSSRADNLLGRTMEFLRSVGFRDQFEILDCELHGCTCQLLLVLQILNMAPEAVPSELSDLAQWQQQNQADRAKDMQELEDNILRALCGLGQQGVRLEDAVKELHATLQAHNQDLGQMVSWLERMDARHTLLSSHLQRVADRVDEVAATTKLILTYLQSQRTRSQQRDAPLPPFLISNATIQYDETPAQDQWGGCGWVVKGFRDRFGVVAIKMYNINQVGEMDMEAAVREAVKLCRVNHHNVVRCFGILMDESSAGARNSVSGSLVMEWVEGGDMYRWLQRAAALVEVDVGVRLMLMLQVAAGMKHLHHQNLVHGDVKPQNVLLQFTNDASSMEEGVRQDVVPTVKICDFGLAKYNATTQTTASNWTTARYSPRYASPERLRTMRRSFEDDVFAFGMLMYFAATSQDPFPDAGDDDLINGVVRGVRPDIDMWVADQRGGEWETQAMRYAQLAKLCWHHKPDQRPNFQEVYAMLEDILWPSATPGVPCANPTSRGDWDHI